MRHAAGSLHWTNRMDQPRTVNKTHDHRNKMTTCCLSVFIYAVSFTPHERPTPWGQPQVTSTANCENRPVFTPRDSSDWSDQSVPIFFGLTNPRFYGLSFLRTIVLAREIDGVRLPGPRACPGRAAVER